MVVKDDLFDRIAGGTKNKAAFGKAINAFIERDRRRRGHVEFIYAALQKMPEFGVEKDLEIYNRLLDVFPKEVFVPRNYIQRMFNHYPRQQECGVEVLEQMENNGESRPGSKTPRFLKTRKSPELIDTAIKMSGSSNVTLCLQRQEFCHLHQITGAKRYIDCSADILFYFSQLC